jgi:hypothetical protein
MGWQGLVEIRQKASEVHKRLRGRNLALLGVLVALVVLFYVMTIVRMGGAGQ